MLTIILLQVMQGIAGLPKSASSLLLFIIAASITVGLVILSVHLIRKKRLYWLVICFGILLFALWYKWIPYFDWNDKRVVPERVDQITVDESPFHQCIWTEFKIGIGPFAAEPLHTYYHDLDQDELCEWIRQRTQDTEHYTYMIAYEAEIDAVVYNAWDGEDRPFPWYGPIMRPKYEISANPSHELIIYRIPRAAIWVE